MNEPQTVLDSFFKKQNERNKGEKGISICLFDEVTSISEPHMKRGGKNTDTNITWATNLPMTEARLPTHRRESRHVATYLNIYETIKR